MCKLQLTTRLKYDLFDQVLLISSTEQACVYLTSKNCHIIFIGSQPTKSKGHFGGVVFSSVMSKVTKRGISSFQYPIIKLLLSILKISHGFIQNLFVFWIVKTNPHASFISRATSVFNTLLKARSCSCQKKVHFGTDRHYHK